MNLMEIQAEKKERILLLPEKKHRRQMLCTNIWYIV